MLSRNGDKVTYDGVVDSEATKAAIIEALNKAYGAANVSGNLSVDAKPARRAGWPRCPASCRSSPPTVPR